MVSDKNSVLKNNYGLKFNNEWAVIICMHVQEFMFIFSVLKMQDD